MQLNIDFRAPDLFGKRAAEDEADDIFASYQIERPELSLLISDDVNTNLTIVSAFRGEGKSALLRMATKKLTDQGRVFLSKTTATAITVDKSSPDVGVLTRLWKSSIYNYVAKQVGTKIGFAWQDDSMGLVEFAQKEGFKSKPWLIAMFDRFKLQIPGGVTVDRKLESLGPAAEETVKRWTAENQAYWLFIDDVDANYKDTKESRSKLMAFFQALREIRNEAPSIRIRASIRPNIWAILRAEYSDLGKLDDYIVDLKWTEVQLRDLLAMRIRAYFLRHGVHSAHGGRNLARISARYSGGRYAWWGTPSRVST